MSDYVYVSVSKATKVWFLSLTHARKVLFYTLIAITVLGVGWMWVAIAAFSLILVSMGLEEVQREIIKQLISKE